MLKSQVLKRSKLDKNKYQYGERYELVNVRRFYFRKEPHIPNLLFMFIQEYSPSSKKQGIPIKLTSYSRYY